MGEMFYPIENMEDTASIIQKQIAHGQIYKTHLSNFLSEVSNLPSDIAINIQPSWRNWHLAVHSHIESYRLLGQNTGEGAVAMLELDRSDASGFASLE